MASTTLLPPPDRAEFAVDDPAAELTALRLERDALTHKLARLGNATHALASELAAVRRALRHERERVTQLTAENARLRVGGAK